MVNIAILEDNPDHASALAAHLDRFAAETSRTLGIAHYADGQSFFDGFVGGRYDMVFIDIQLPDANGMDVARKLRERDESVLLFFVTNLAHYAVGGYEVGAFDFIVKPVTYPNLAMKLRRAFECLDKQASRELWVATRAGKKLVRADKLKYVEIMKHTLVFHMTDGEVSGTGTLKNVQEKLDGLPFALCNRCYYVNLKFVTEVTGAFCHVGGDVLQISGPKKRDFMVALNNYLASSSRR